MTSDSNSGGAQNKEDKLSGASDRDKDIKYGQTSAGPHKDDLCILSGETDMRKFGSQGQQRTCALSMKLAEIEMTRERMNDNPVLLLDDVLSELDSQRQNLLLKKIKDIQTLITCTGLDDMVKNHFHSDRVIEIKKGTATVL